MVESLCNMRTDLLHVYMLSTVTLYIVTYSLEIPLHCHVWKATFFVYIVC